MLLVISGFFVHLTFLASIFDIYFKSPVVHGIVPQTSPVEAPARRLVLFVADGLRADSCFLTDDLSDSNIPFLRSIIESRGTWGVSHTRVPTESRPGHVALIAGFYEDPSAIAKGWKENPVEYDSVFNESRYTWSWGGPDVVPMFAKGASGTNVYVETYGYEVEDFSGKKSTTNLDKWVFKKVEEFLLSAKTDSALSEKLHQDKIVLFLHLLGLDTAGHTHKPHSLEYKENIRYVDSEIKRLEELIEEFYEHDKKTAYIFTADHGMTDWGSHGAGDKSETETPLIAWGAGIHGPRSIIDNSDQDSPIEWRLGHLTRKDVNQADVAPLMASLIGVPVPVNSVGTLPQDYLDVSDYQLSELMLQNARQMMAQYDKKREMTEADTLSWLYREFPLLSIKKEAEFMNVIHSFISSNKYNESIALSKKLISLCLLGLDYYQNYHQNLLLTCITLTFIGWITWLFLTLIHDKSTFKRNTAFLDVEQTRASFSTKLFNFAHTRMFVGGYWINMIFLCAFILSVILLLLQTLPAQFYIYCLMPVLIWWAVARHYSAFIASLSQIKKSMGIGRFTMLVVLYVIGIEILVLSFFYRFFLSIGMMGLAAWPIVSSKCDSFRHPRFIGWFGSCLFIAVFPLLPVVGREPNTQLVATSGWLFLLLAAYSAWKLEIITTVCKNCQTQTRFVNIFHLIMLPFAIWNLLSTASSIKEKQGLLLLNQIVSWLMLGSSLFLPLFSSLQIFSRLYSVGLSLIVPFLLLSASHEGFFVLALTLNMFCWLLLEHESEDASKTKLIDFTFDSSPEKEVSVRSLSSRDFRRAYFFLFYIFVSFFGIGNIASINSFDPTWVRCFLTVFSPFTMTLLILWKITIPFLAVTCTFRALNIIVQAPTGKLFFIVLIFSDAMGLHFLHLVTNRGSWLDIGSSISHYVIVQATVLIVVFLYGLARVLTDISIWPMKDAVSHCHIKYSKYDKSVSIESGAFKVD